MLTITVMPKECFLSSSNMFVTIPNAPKTIVLEHSLVSLAKWEARWKKPFLSQKNKKEAAELVDYIRCMTITQNVHEDVYKALSMDAELLQKITEYMEDPHTATTISKMEESRSGLPRNSIITAELIYYWMIELNIPIEFQKWHLNRLLMLIRVINIKHSPGKKMPKNTVTRRNRSLNASRKKRLGTRG